MNSKKPENLYGPTPRTYYIRKRHIIINRDGLATEYTSISKAKRASRALSSAKNTVFVDRTAK